MISPALWNGWEKRWKKFITEQCIRYAGEAFGIDRLSLRTRRERFKPPLKKRRRLPPFYVLLAVGETGPLEAKRRQMAQKKCIFLPELFPCSAAKNIVSFGKYDIIIEDNRKRAEAVFLDCGRAIFLPVWKRGETKCGSQFPVRNS